MKPVGASCSQVEPGGASWSQLEPVEASWSQLETKQTLKKLRKYVLSNVTDWCRNALKCLEMDRNCFKRLYVGYISFNWLRINEIY